MKERILNLNFDSLGITVSSLCAIHCLMLPALFVLFKMETEYNFLHGRFEQIFFIMAILIAFPSFTHGYLKHHRNWRPIAFSGLGIVLITASIIIHGENHHLVGGLGGISLAIAHYLNWILSKEKS